MANKLKGLSVTSVDVVNAGANPDAHVRLFKRKEGEPEDGATFLQKAISALTGIFEKPADIEKADGVAKEAVTFAEELEQERMRETCRQMWDICYALQDSFSSIICDGEQDTDAKLSMMFTSLDEFAEVMRGAIPKWAAGEKAGHHDDVAKSVTGEAAFNLHWGQYAKAKEGGGEANSNQTESNTDDSGGDADGITKQNDPEPTGENQSQKEDTEMKIDKSKMTADEQAVLADFEKRYGAAEPTANADGGGNVNKGGAQPPQTANVPELHPEVKKALDEAAEVRKSQDAKIEELTKSLEIANLTNVAKKYEVIGKKADELAAKLYEMKKAGGTVYDDYVALLDESVTNVEKSGMFREIGSNMNGTSDAVGKLGAAAQEVAKGNTNIGDAAAIVKAFEENPDLAAQYEAEYAGGGK